MNYLFFISIVFFLISLAYKSEEKKKEQKNETKVFPNRNQKAVYGEGSAFNRKKASKVNEQSILEKATSNMEASNPVYKVGADKESGIFENSSALAEYSQPFRSQKQSVPKEVKSRAKKENGMKEPVKRTVSLEGTENKEKVSSYHEIFDGFGASDALYLARKDVKEQRAFL